MCCLLKALAKDNSLVSILRSRTHKFKHHTLSGWLLNATSFIQDVLKQWLEDATLLDNMLKSWVNPAAMLAKGAIMDKEKAALRKALIDDKNYKPLKNGVQLVSKWRNSLKNIHVDSGLPSSGSKVLQAVGEAINNSLAWLELIEMVDEITKIVNEKSVFLRKDLLVCLCVFQI